MYLSCSHHDIDLLSEFVPTMPWCSWIKYSHNAEDTHSRPKYWWEWCTSQISPTYACDDLSKYVYSNSKILIMAKDIYDLWKLTSGIHKMSTQWMHTILESSVQFYMELPRIELSWYVNVFLVQTSLSAIRGTPLLHRPTTWILTAHMTQRINIMGICDVLCLTWPFECHGAQIGFQIGFQIPCRQKAWQDNALARWN